MAKVFVVLLEIAYEGSTLRKVFATRKAAEAYILKEEPGAVKDAWGDFKIDRQDYLTIAEMDVE